MKANWISIMQNVGRTITAAAVHDVCEMGMCSFFCFEKKPNIKVVLLLAANIQLLHMKSVQECSVHILREIKINNKL